MKDTQARLEEQEQNKVYLDKILAVIKDRDPVLLQAITSSLASRLVHVACLSALDRNCFYFQENIET